MSAQLVRRFGEDCYRILIDASNANRINENHLMEMAYQMSPSVAGNVQRYLKLTGGYDGGPSFQYLLHQWCEIMPEDASVDKIVRILQSDDIRLNALAQDLKRSQTLKSMEARSSNNMVSMGATNSNSMASMEATRLNNMVSMGPRKPQLEATVEASRFQPSTIETSRSTSQRSEMQELECPVCLEMMFPPTHIFQCAANHLICEDCKNGMDRNVCPTCMTERIIGRAYTLESIASRMAPVLSPGTSQGAMANPTSSKELPRSASVRKEVPRNFIENMGASGSNQKAAPIYPSLNKVEIKNTPRPMDQLLEQAEPLFAAFRQGRIGLSQMKRLSEKMKIMGNYNSIIYSVVHVEMGARMKELIRTWYMREGKSGANIEKLIQILLDIQLRAVAEDIIENVFP